MEGKKPNVPAIIRDRTSSRSKSPSKRQSFIPERTSSRSVSPKKGRATSPSKDIATLERDLSYSTYLVVEQRKRIKLAHSFDSQYWTAQHKYAELEIEQTRLTTKFSAAKMQVSLDEFEQSPKGQQLVDRERILNIQKGLFQTQADKMKDDSRATASRRSFVSHFMGSHIGWRMNISSAKRTKDTQIQWREDLIKVTGSKHPEYPTKDKFWCPVTHRYWTSHAMIAGHLFPHRAGEESFKAIFGDPMKDENGISEYHKPDIGIYWCSDAEIRFTKRLFTIVPGHNGQPAHRTTVRTAG